MAMSVGSSGGDDYGTMSEINTTPLVDVMMVLLIIFLITIPVITKQVKVTLPKAVNALEKVKPKDINIAVTTDGTVYWDGDKVSSMQRLVQYVEIAAHKNPQPVVHIRGDANTQYQNIGKVIAAINRGGLVQVGFVIEPNAQEAAIAAAQAAQEMYQH